MLMNTGKNTTATTTAWLLSDPVIPNQALKMGARATIGVALTATASGVNPSWATRNRVVNTASSTPSRIPASRPLTAIRPVSQPAWRISPHSSPRRARIELGRGSRNSWIPNPATAPSQRASPATPTTRGGAAAQNRDNLTPQPPQPVRPPVPR